MINYSVSYRSRWITENGQRVKKAFAYGTARSAGSMTSAEFAAEATKKSVYGSGVLLAVVTILADELIKKAKMSYMINCGDLGIFSPGITSAGVEDIATFSASAHISKSYMKWKRGSKLAKLKDVSYKLDQTASDLAALSRANKNAATTVNLGDSAVKELARTQNAPQS